MKQSHIQSRIGFIAQNNGYDVTLRKKPRSQHAGVKKFFPDVVAKPFKGTRRRVFEVEATVTNNTIFKSLASLLYFTCHSNSEAYLVVPEGRKVFAQGCLDAMSKIIRAHSKTMKGANPKIRCRLITFRDVITEAEKVQKRLDGAGAGAPPKCSFLPRPK